MGDCMLERLGSDLFDAIRSLKADTLIVTAGVMTLAASIAMNVAMFGLIDRALVNPPRHVARPDRLFSVAFQVPGQPEGQAGMTTTSYPTYRHTARSGLVVHWGCGVAAWAKQCDD
jgi:hypothetical protein